ncbi:menaquinone biosynthesis protein [Aliibacillus thermotolerans]|mgnify:CR=1 FL=1|uniref:Chorismate dehydratase n=1 Tax=Aliibacillus thermotolerans TaxID=1834418 RepID=A0ABW0U7M7_9BACI|nr:menaquinone biosynthesis protein [Aliibacillus thermotolerans]MDA3130197.1 hypothetical protein [Aliibacillus thermotolerans]
MSLVIGEIAYTNIVPPFYCLNREELEKNGCRFVPKVPAGLNAAMKQGEVDVGGISSFAYGKEKGKYVLMPHLSVTAYGPVGSIFLFSKYPLESLEGKNIALTSASATSVHLLKVILKEFLHFTNITFTTVTPDAEKMNASFDAFLLIGDDAIRTFWKREKLGVYYYDLGQLWYEYTGFPMTYAVFAVRKEAAEEKKDMVHMLYKQFIESKKKALGPRFNDMITYIQQRHGGTEAFWRAYFRNLHYQFDEKEKEGLLYYYKLAYEHGYFERPVTDIEMWMTGNEVRDLL